MHDSPLPSSHLLVFLVYSRNDDTHISDKSDVANDQQNNELCAEVPTTTSMGRKDYSDTGTANNCHNNGTIILGVA